MRRKSLKGTGLLRELLLVLAAALMPVTVLLAGLPFQVTSATYVDDEQVGGNQFTTASCFLNWLYVADITFDSKTGGNKHDERIKVTIRRDDNANCIAEDTDAPVKKASVTVELQDSGGAVVATVSGTTKGKGVFKTGWLTDLPDDTYYAYVTSLTHATYAWNQDLDVVNPASHTNPH